MRSGLDRDTPSVVSVDVAWSIEQVVAIAPTPARFAAADAIAAPSRWVAVGADEQAVWGRCRGSGREPYETMVDHAHLAWRCTCPSRSHPCKHALALLIMWVKGQVPAAPTPTGVRSWVDGHARRETAGDGSGTGPAALVPPADELDDAEPLPDGPPDLERQRDERIARLLGGLVELDRWLDDRLRTGLADPALARYATWDDLAARLVDARAGALANRVRRLAGLVGARPDWHEVVLAELGILHLLAQAGQRVPEPARRPGRRGGDSCGWQVRQADVLASASPTPTRWLVAGRSDTREDLIEVRRMWLRGLDRSDLGDGAVVRRLPTVPRHVARRRRRPPRRPPPLPGPSWRALIGDSGRLAGPDDRVVRGGALPPTSRERATRSARRCRPSRGSTGSRRPSSPRRRSVAEGGCSATTLARCPLPRGDPGVLATLLAASAGLPVTSPSSGPRRRGAAHRLPARSHARRRPTRRPLVRERGMTRDRAPTRGTSSSRSPCSAPTAATRRSRPTARSPTSSTTRCRPTPQARMLAVGGGDGRRPARRRPPARRRRPPLCPRRRPAGRCCRPAAARRWFAVVANWPVLEHEWLAAASAHGRRPPPDVLVACCVATGAPARRRASCAVGGRSRLAASSTSPPCAAVHGAAGPAGRAAPRPARAADLDAARGRSGRGGPAVVAGSRRRLQWSHRAVLVNFVRPAPAPTPAGARQRRRRRSSRGHIRRRLAASLASR